MVKLSYAKTIGIAFSAIQKFIIDSGAELVSSGSITKNVLNDTKKKYYRTLIKDFIKRNNRFLNQEEVTDFGIPPIELARFIVENEESIVQNNLLDQASVEQAKQIMSGEGI